MILSKFFKNHLTIPQATELFEKVKSQTHPDIANLKRLVNFHKAPVGTKNEMQALNLKYRAMTHIPTTIEKTMTPAQLYDADCPLWCAEYSIEQLSYYFTLPFTFESSHGALAIQYIENSIIPYIDLQKTFKNSGIGGVVGNIHGTSQYPSTIMSHHMIIPDKPRKKGTAQVPPSGPFA